MTIDQVITLVRKLHFPNDPASFERIEEFEKRSGFKLPDDMRTFYLACDGASLFRNVDVPPFTILQIRELQTASAAIYGSQEADCGESCFAFCDRGDGDYVAIEIGNRTDNTFPIIDVWHEAYPDPEYCKVIASSFCDFLTKALESGGKSKFW